MKIMSAPRIAIFDDWWPIHIGDERKDPAADKPEDWAKFLETPNFRPASYDGYYTVDDQRAVDEIHRLVKFKTCPICRRKMEQILGDYDGDTLLLCMKCGYWGGRGFREWGMHHHMFPTRGVIARYKPLAPIDEETDEYLVTHLRRLPKDMTKISPLRAEKFVVALLSDYLDCEVKALGGTKDNGVDGYVLKGDKIRSIIQVKWRQDMDKAEGVSVVREVAGTLLTSGIPSGILVSNRDHFSEPAIADAKTVSKRRETELGKMNLSLYDYYRIIDMLEISNIKLTAKMSVNDWFQVPESICVFDGASGISRSDLEGYLSEDRIQDLTNKHFSQGTTSAQLLREDDVLEIIRRVKTGDEEAISRLVALKKIRSICRQIVNNSECRLTHYYGGFDDFFVDVIADVAIRLFRDKPEFESAESFFRWVASRAWSTHRWQSDTRNIR